MASPHLARGGLFPLLPNPFLLYSGHNNRQYQRGNCGPLPERLSSQCLSLLPFISEIKDENAKLRKVADKTINAGFAAFFSQPLVFLAELV
jgi:hypothetical protein